MNNLNRLRMEKEREGTKRRMILRRREIYLCSGITRHSGLPRLAEKQLNPNLTKTEASIGEWTANSPSLHTNTRSVKAEASKNCHKVCERNVVWSIF